MKAIKFNVIISWIKTHQNEYLNFGDGLIYPSEVRIMLKYMHFKSFNTYSFNDCTRNKTLYYILQYGSHGEISNFFNALTIYERYMVSANNSVANWGSTSFLFTCLYLFCRENFNHYGFSNTILKYKNEINYVIRHYSNIGLRSGLVESSTSFAAAHGNQLIFDELRRRKWILPFALYNTPIYSLLSSLGPIINKYMY